MKRILVVDDNPNDLKKYLTLINLNGHKAHGVTNLNHALKELESNEYNILITDIHLVPGDESDTPKGLVLLKDVKTLHPEVLLIATSNDPNVEIFDRALAYGALHFIRKPTLSWDDIAIAIKLAQQKFNSKNSIKSINVPSFLKEKYPDGIIIDPKLRKRLINISHNPTIPLVINGETGTGKEEVAKIIWQSRCKDEGDIPFVAVNCAHLKSDLSHSHFFGHKRGAFTGANETTRGFVGEANGGILFLDEIHTLSLGCQQDLLRVLNDGTYNRVGDSKTLKSGFQLIVASTKDLEDEVDNGTILLDLASRIVGSSVSLAPLRERKHDIKDLVQLFLIRMGKNVTKSQIDSISSKCSEYYWQGNIRLLKQAIKVLVMEAEMLDEEYGPQHLPKLKLMNPPRFIQTESEALRDSVVNGTLSLDEAVGIFEKDILQFLLKKYSKISEVATLLKMGRSTLDAKRKKYALN